MNVESMKKLLTLIHLFKTYEILDMDEEIYPAITEQDMEYISDKCVCYEGCSLVFPYVNMKNKTPFIDIYFYWLSEEKRVESYRLVIVEGKRLPKDKESDLFWLVDNNEFLMISNYRLGQFKKSVNKNYYGKIHIEEYKYNQIGEIIKTIYFSLHANTLETLYKSKLNVIADNIGQINDANFIGRSPSNIVCNFPIRLLKILNNEELVSNLFTEESQQEALKVYKVFSGFFAKNLPNVAQWLYFSKLYSCAIMFDRKIYTKLEKVTYDAGHFVNLYLEYASLKEEVKPFYEINYLPEVSDIKSEYNSILTLKRYIDNKENINGLFQKIKEESDYDFEDSTYAIITPNSLEQYLKEASSQHNCLIDYLDDVLTRKTMIVFMRKKNVLDKSYITVEIKDEIIVQAYGKFNREINMAEYSFLERYAESKGLCCSLDLLGDYEERYVI